MQFRQSLTDFPLTVSLGKKAPAWSLSRWGGNEGLRFVPPDDEAFTLRGDRRRFLYRGRRRSHRFTILGDTAFEYDCILEREPASNVITVLLEGVENYDFFKQPDFVPELFLKGSLAVYKKEIMVGEGTGKLCHIHRPEIIDARGLRCWGELSVVGNELRITIPEKWLSEAAYPVLVDPTIGTTSVGSQNKWIREPGEPSEPLLFEWSIPVNRFLVSEAINGQCTAFVYTNQDDYEAGGRPVIYSDNGNKPLSRLTTQENSLDLRVIAGKPAGWRSATFNSNGSITAGSYIWFGVLCEYYWHPRFDWGVRCYADWWDEYTSIPNIYPITQWTDIYDFKLSMYFTYSSAQYYIRTLTQGVSLNDSRMQSGSYTRVATQTAGVGFGLSSLKMLLRYVSEIVGVIQLVEKSSNLLRKFTSQTVGILDRLNKGAIILKIAERVQAQGVALHGLFILVRIVTGVISRDFFFGRFLKARTEIVIKSPIVRELFLDSKIN